MPTSKCRKTFDDKMKGITLVVFAVDVVILITVLIILWTMPEPRTPGENCGYMCLKCADNQDTMCCGCRDEILQQFVMETFNQTYYNVSAEYSAMFTNREAKLHNGSTSDVKPVAHLIGETRDKPSEDTQGVEVSPVKKWYRGNNCLLLNGIVLHRGRYRVPVTGFYYVYSVIDFNYQYVHNGTVVDVQSRSPCMRHAIYKSNIMSPHKEKQVMCTHHPYEMSKNLIFSRYDTFIGGDVYLEAGEEIYVKIANISYASSPPKNVFGIHLI